MKKLIFLFSFVLAALIASAQRHILTVSNDPNRPAQFTDLQAAIDSAQAGDTIYVLGSPIAYGDITIKYLKDSITLIGAGFEPLSYNSYYSELGTVYLKGADYVTIKGFVIYSVNINRYYIEATSSNDFTSNIIIENNKCDHIYITASHDILIQGNVVEKISFVLFSERLHIYNVMIKNNYLSYISGWEDRVSFSAFNNIFVNDNNNSYGVIGHNGNIRNNIFYLYIQDTEPWKKCSDCRYDNNLFYNTNTYYPLSTSDTSITNNGNILNQDPQFVNFAKPYSVDRLSFKVNFTRT